MALSLGVRAGSRIRIGTHELEVKALVQPNLILISVDGGKEIAISDQEKTRILPGVDVFYGVSPNSGSGQRLAFIAPKEIHIRRISA